MIHWAGRQQEQSSGYWQSLWGLVYPWLVYQGMGMLVTFVFAWIMVLMNPAFVPTSGSLTDYFLQFSEEVKAYYLPLAAISCALSIPLLLLFFFRDRKQEIREGFVLESWEKTGAGSFALCLLCGISASIVLNHCLIYSGVYEWLSEGYADSAQMMFQGNLWLELLTICLLTPLVEELIFRGLIFRRLRWSLDAKAAILTSALLFAVFHGNLLQGIYAFAMGFLFAFVYERTHSLWAPILFHLGANVVSVLMTEVEGFKKIYAKENEKLFLLLTFAMMVLFVISFYLLYVRVRPAGIECKDSADTLAHIQEDEYGKRTI